MLRPSSIALVQPLIVHRLFGLLWLGQTLSRIGDKLYVVALGWWVLEKTGSAAIMGTVLIASFVPMLIFFLIGGIAVDRFSRGKLLLYSDLIRGVLIALATVLAVTGVLAIWHIVLISIVFGFADAFFYPAYTAMIPDVVPTEMLASANSLTELSKQLAGVAGPLLAAVIISSAGTSLAFGINSLSFFLSALCLLPLVARPHETEPQKDAAAPKGQKHGILAEFKEGITTVTKQPWIWISILMAGLTNLTFTAPYETSLPLLVDQHFGAGAGLLGYIHAMVSLGAVMIAILISRMGRIRNRGRVAYGMWIMAGLAAMMFGFDLPIPLILAAAFLRGAGMTGMNLLWITILQELIPREKLGRVASIDLLGSLALLPVGYGVAGIMSDVIGPSQVFVYGGLATAVMLSLAVMHPQIRNLD